MVNNKLFIAEIKTASPWNGFKSPYTWDCLLSLAAGCTEVDYIAVHTNPRWGGDYSLLSTAEHRTGKKIIAKGFHKSKYEQEMCINYGADLVWVVGFENNTQYTLRTIFEPEDALSWNGKYNIWNNYYMSHPPFVAVNKRNIYTGQKRDVSNFNLKVPNPGTINGSIKYIQASFIETIADLEPQYDGFIVGEHLVKFIDSLQK